jgi:6-phosphofructokinase 1
MNAAIRAVTRCALELEWEVLGVREGFLGLSNGNFVQLRARDVGGMIQRGGTMLGSARCPEFAKEEVRLRALHQLGANDVTALVVIGGNGSQTGGNALYQMGFQVVGVASTIDNDLLGSEITIGVDTALNIALEAIDRLKTTASSHRRAFLVEVMGRDCGYLALMSGIAGGAEVVVVPEIDTSPEAIAHELRSSYERGKSHGLVVVAEGAKLNAEQLEKALKEQKSMMGFDVRATTLGHVQRGGAPTAYDRLLASRLGAGAVEAIKRGESGVLVGLVKGRISTTPYNQVVGRTKGIDPELFALAKTLEK